MAGMETLGRLCNVIPIASGVAFKMRGASVAMFVLTGSTAVATLQQQPGFGGTPVTLPMIKDVYWSTQTNGTAAWNKLTYNANALAAPFASGPIATYTHGTTTGLTTATCSVFHIFTSELSDPENYVLCTATGSGLLSVYLGDLVHQRGPANLEILSA
jgi:hypothetical protein